MLKQQSVFLAIYLLYSLTNIVKSPNDLPDKVISVNNLRGVFEESGGNIGILLPHITYEISDSFAAFQIPLFQIINKLLLASVGKDIKNTFRSGIGNDALIFDIAGIALKFVDSEYMKKLFGGVKLSISKNRMTVETDKFTDLATEVKEHSHLSLSMI